MTFLNAALSVYGTINEVPSPSSPIKSVEEKDSTTISSKRNDISSQTVLDHQDTLIAQAEDDYQHFLQRNELNIKSESSWFDYNGDLDESGKKKYRLYLNSQLNILTIGISSTEVEGLKTFFSSMQTRGYESIHE